MGQTQMIVVSGPLEALFYKSAGPILEGLVVFILLAILLNKFSNWLAKKRHWGSFSREYHRSQNIALWTAAVAGVATLLWIAV